MWKAGLVFAICVLEIARAQIPSLGFCPDYVPMTNFDMDRFAGPWYEAERYFQLTEVASRCVMSNYTKGSDGKYRVSNEVTSRFTGIKRILEGEIRIPANKRDEGKLIVRYTSVPLITPETTYSILETDYDNFAVMWSCSGVGPVHTQNAWIMTRKRLAPGEILQKAYAVLDKYKISKTFFVKTDQDDCAFLDTLPPRPVKRPSTEAPAVDDTEQVAADEPVREFGVRDQIITPDAPNIVKSQVKIDITHQYVPQHEAADTANAAGTEVKSVPEVIMKIASEVHQEQQQQPIHPQQQQHHQLHHHEHPQQLNEEVAGEAKSAPIVEEHHHKEIVQPAKAVEAEEKPVEQQQPAEKQEAKVE